MSRTGQKAGDPPPTYRRGPLKAAWYWLSSVALWTAFKLLYRLRIEGQANVPLEGPVVLLANHTSHFDPAIIGGATRRQLSALARDTLFVGPFGWLIRSYDAVPVDREGASLAGVRATLKRLKQGGAVLLFPEGTRSADGELQAFKPGFVALVRRSGATIVPVGIAGAHEAWPKHRSRARLGERIAVVYGAPLSSEQAGDCDDSRLVELSRQRVEEALDAARRLGGGG
ncbi:lysophospholipid acyltransferase family protein [Botrimarina sp.]|uniref:lysophospholipid acyltransferase family protein n=1 Tax=Botrimarina sp. TaxID=2795802 RepID=UPI0032EAA3F4